MKIGIITPAPPRTRYGNRVTALRWARLLKHLGHRVIIAQHYTGQSFDLLIALHARRSHSSVRRFHQVHPDRPLIVALTGTDLYRDLKKSEQARRSLELATRIITLQPEALKELPRHWQRKTRVIYQSVQPVQISKLKAESSDHFTVCVIGHLRAVKDPFRAAMAARLLPASSRIRVIHIGRAMTGAMKRRAQREMEINPRYEWLGELSQPETLRLLAASDL
jgi:glycosyltransferase involved in cell wall biosynthesis